MERLSDSHSGDLGTDLFREKDTLLGLGREIRRLRSNGDAPERIRELLGDAFELRFEPGTTTLRMPNGESVWEVFVNGYSPTKALATSCDHSGGSSYGEILSPFTSAIAAISGSPCREIT
jgi:hypothetical protein